MCDPGDSHENDISLYAKIEGRKEHITLDTLSYSSYKVFMPIHVLNGPTPDLPWQAKVKTMKTMLGVEENTLF